MNASMQLIAALDRLSRSIKLSVEQQKQQSKTIIEYAQTYDDERKRNPPSPPIVRSEIQIPPGVIQAYQANQTEQNRREGRAFTVSLLTLIALVIYTVFTGVTVSEIRKSNDLIRSQLIGTMAAIVKPPEFAISQQGRLQVFVRNSGHIIARSIQFNFAITRESLPDQKRIGAKVSSVFRKEQIPPEPEGRSEFEEYDIPGFDWESLLKMEQTVRVEGDFSFNDGFQDVPVQHICVAGVSVEFVPCKYFANRLTDALKAKELKAKERTTTPSNPHQH
jgi:hypothetical protein